jgi:hypothetical protein
VELDRSISVASFTIILANVSPDTSSVSAPATSGVLRTDPALLSYSVHYDQFIYPPYDAPLMDAYGGQFESLYVILHPFIRVPDLLAWKATGTYPTDEQILSQGTKYRWAPVAAQTGLHTFARLNHALLTTIRSIKEELCDYPACKTLLSFLQAESVWMPEEGRFEPLLQTDLLDAFAAAGHDELIFVPEFPHLDPIQRLKLSKLMNRACAFPPKGTLLAPDLSFLFTVDWDSFFTLFYGPRKFLTEAVRRNDLEGFFASSTTEHFWFNYSFGCSIVTVSPEAC